jgi:lysozyme family protein
MAKFENSMKILMKLEFSSEIDALEKNKTEDGYTYMGIYQKAHPEWSGWDLIKNIISKSPSLKDASKLLYSLGGLTEKVFDFYYTTFWKPYKLDEIEEQHKADEIFIFGVNVGMSNAIKISQSLVHVDVDGKMGPMTIKAINASDYSFFDKEFDDAEIEYYKKIIKNNLAKGIFFKGWVNRAEAV